MTRGAEVAQQRHRGLYDSGALKSSPALAARLAKAEQELSRLETTRQAPKRLIPGIADEYRARVDELEAILSPDGLHRSLVSDRDIAPARAQLRRRLGGNILVVETESEIRFQTEASAGEMALRMAGNGSQVFMVAGACFVLSRPYPCACG